MNQQNMRKANVNNKSGVLGVFFISKSQKWTARLRRRGKDYHIGSFDTKEEAGAAYIQKKRMIHEGCTI